MRIARTLGFTLLLAAPVVADAQAANPRTQFEDSWYWGAKAGMSSFDPNGGGRINANAFGGEFLITRTRGALMLSVDQSFFDDVAGVFDPSASGSVRPVDVSDWRRYSAALLAFPVRWGALRPYLGAGLSINVIQNADPKGTFINQASQSAVFDRVSEQTSKVSALLIGGAQVNAGRLGFFAQASAMPTRNNFLISGSSHTFVVEGGVRFNLASAIEKLQ
jgi:hypothetical protein